jgi:hypothetical protein
VQPCQGSSGRVVQHALVIHHPSVVGAGAVSSGILSKASSVVVLAGKGGKKQSCSFPIPSALDDGSSETSSAMVGDSQTSPIGLVVVESLAALVVMDKEEEGEVALCLVDGEDGDSPSSLDIYSPIALGDSGFSD